MAFLQRVGQLKVDDKKGSCQRVWGHLGRPTHDANHHTFPSTSMEVFRFFETFRYARVKDLGIQMKSKDAKSTGLQDWDAFWGLQLRQMDGELEHVVMEFYWNGFDNRGKNTGENVRGHPFF